MLLLVNLSPLTRVHRVFVADKIPRLFSCRLPSSRHSVRFLDDNVRRLAHKVYVPATRTPGQQYPSLTLPDMYTFRHLSEKKDQRRWRKELENVLRLGADCEAGAYERISVLDFHNRSLSRRTNLRRKEALL